LNVRRLLTTLAVLAVAMLLVVPTVAGASPHFKHGGEPDCTVAYSGSSATVVCSGELAGLGNQDLVIVSTVSGFALYTCENRGGTQAPGQNKVLEGPSTVPTIIPSGEIKNGTLAFTTNPNTLTAAPTVSAAVAGCPNNNWMGVNPTLSITSVDLTISQGGVLLFTCTASNPNGLSGTVALAC
jgi:hypothetical protein